MQRSSRAYHPALIGLAAILVACRSESPTTEHEPLPALRAPTWTSTDSFTYIADVRRLGDGRTLVLDFAEKAVRMLDITGATMASVGGEGSGPGEFRAPVKMLSLPVDSTLVLDRTLLRLTLVWPPGSMERSIHFPEAVGFPLSTARGVLPDGRLVYQATPMAAPGTSATSAIMAIRLNETQPESLFAIRIPEAVPIRAKSGGGRGSQVVPYALEDDWAVASDGAIAIVRSEPFHIEWRLPTGEIVTGPTQSFDAVAVTDSERTAHPGFSLPAQKPPFVSGATLIDPLGRVWVRRTVSHDSRTRRWSVFNRRGLPVGDVELPGSRRIIHLAGAGVYVIKTDADDRPWLEFYEWNFIR